MKNVNQCNNGVPMFIQQFFDIVDVIISCVAIITVVSSFIFKIPMVSGDSMLDTLHNEDRLVLQSLMYTPRNGDIVVIPRTRDIPVPIVKRVVATQGQTLKIDFENNNVYVDGELLNEDYVSSKTIRGDAAIPEKIPDGYVFVMGDNRSNSTDSRFKDVGLVKVEDILGKAQFIVWPVNRLRCLF